MHLAQRLGLTSARGVNALLIALAIDSVGSGLFIAFSLLYFTTVAGLPLAQVGITLTLASIVGLTSNPVSGALVDRFGAYRVLLGSFVLSAVGFAGFLFVGSLPMLFLTALIEMSGIRAFWVAFPALIADASAADQRDRWFAVTGAAQAVGYGAGGLIAGLLVGIGGKSAYTWLLAANTVSFLLAMAVLAARVPEPPMRPRERSRDEGFRAIVADRPFVCFALASVIFALCIMMSVYALPVYVVDILGAPAWVVGALFAVNTGLLILQPVLVRHLTLFRRTRVMAAAGGVWIGSCLLFVAALGVPSALIVPYLFLSVAIYTVGDALFSPVSTALAAAAGPDAMRGRYIATLSLAWGIAATIAPAFCAGLFSLDDAAPWVAASVLAALGVVLILRAEAGLPAVAVRVLATGPDPLVASDSGIVFAEV